MALSALKSIMGQNESAESTSCNPTLDSKEEIKSRKELAGDDEFKKSSLPTLLKFTDFRKPDKSPIHEVDPILLKKFIGHNVTVVNTSQEEFHGCCLAIDPVSLSVILAKRVPGGRIRVITLPGYYLTTIYVNPSRMLPEELVSVNDLDVAELYHAPSLYSEKVNCFKVQKEKERGNLNGDKIFEQKENTNLQYLTQGFEDNELEKLDAEKVSGNPKLTEQEISNRKKILKELLEKNKMPVTVKGDNLEIPGGVTISPPYTLENCDTRGNPVIKKKLGDLLAVFLPNQTVCN